MKTTMLCSALLLALPAGCALQPQAQPPWGMAPVVSVRHGGAGAQAHYQTGRYFQGQRRLDQAEAAFQRAIELDAQHVEAHNALAALYAERGELARAEESFRKVLAAAPEAAHLHSNLGYVLLLQGHHDEALAALRRALALDPGLERAWDNLARLAAARSDALLAEQARSRRLDGVAAAPAPGTPAAPARARGPQRWAAGKIRNAGGFELIAVSRELQADGGVIRLAALPATPAISTTPPTPAASAAPRPAPEREPTAFRLELSNGNGVTGFAMRFGRQLRSEGIAVSRITNQKPYSIATTTIEYRPGYEGAARSLAARTGVPGHLVEARQARQGTDIRLVLGRDLVDRAAARVPAVARL